MDLVDVAVVKCGETSGMVGGIKVMVDRVNLNMIESSYLLATFLVLRGFGVGKTTLGVVIGSLLGLVVVYVVLQFVDINDPRSWIVFLIVATLISVCFELVVRVLTALRSGKD